MSDGGSGVMVVAVEGVAEFWWVIVVIVAGRGELWKFWCVMVAARGGCGDLVCAGGNGHSFKITDQAPCVSSACNCPQSLRPI